MHFGRVANPDGIDFNLPPDAPRTTAFLRLPWGGTGRLHVGCPVWSCKEWVGTLYPRGIKATDYLNAYAAQFNSSEVSSTFYHILDDKMIKGWAQRVPTSFRFCPKVYRGITEQLGGPNCKALIAQCAANFAAFGDRYGLGLAQFPETFAPSGLAQLKQFLEAWPRALPLAVELRHPGWFHTTL